MTSQLPPLNLAAAERTLPRGLSSENYDLVIRQQPQHARVAVGKEKDRKPVDPPPIIQLKVDPSIDPGQSFLQSPYYFMSCNLLTRTTPAGDDKPEFVNSALAGTLVSSLHRLKDANNLDGGFFVFGDLSVKMEGKFRLQFSLFEMSDTEVLHLKSINSDVFTVHSSKNFPGMAESTFLTRSFSDQGVRLRLRKEPRTLPRKRGAAADESTRSVNNTSGRQTPSDSASGSRQAEFNEPDSDARERTARFPTEYPPPRSEQPRVSDYGAMGQYAARQGAPFNAPPYGSKNDDDDNKRLRTGSGGVYPPNFDGHGPSGSDNPGFHLQQQQQQHPAAYGHFPQQSPQHMFSGNYPQSSPTASREYNQYLRGSQPNSGSPYQSPGGATQNSSPGSYQYAPPTRYPTSQTQFAQLAQTPLPHRAPSTTPTFPSPGNPIYRGPQLPSPNTSMTAAPGYPAMATTHAEYGGMAYGAAMAGPPATTGVAHMPMHPTQAPFNMRPQDPFQ